MFSTAVRELQLMQVSCSKFSSKPSIFMAYQIIKKYKNKVHADKTDMISLRRKAATAAGKTSPNPITPSPINYLFREWINTSDGVRVPMSWLTSLQQIRNTTQLSRLEWTFSMWMDVVIVSSEKSIGRSTAIQLYYGVAALIVWTEQLIDFKSDT